MPAASGTSSSSAGRGEAVEPDGWIRLHPLSAPLLAGRFILFGLALSAQVWGEALTDRNSGDLIPAAGLVARVGAALVVGGLGVLAFAALAWRFRMYRVGAEKVELKTGILFRSYRQLPFERIESVDTGRPLVPRLLGLAEVRVEAISKQGNELRLRYLSFHEAERLRLEIAARRRLRAVEPPLALDAPAPIVRLPAAEMIMGYLVLPALAGAAAVAVAAVLAGLLGGLDAALAVGAVGASVMPDRRAAISNRRRSASWNERNRSRSSLPCFEIASTRTSARPSSRGTSGRPVSTDSIRSNGSCR